MCETEVRGVAGRRLARLAERPTTRANDEAIVTDGFRGVKSGDEKLCRATNSRVAHVLICSYDVHDFWAGGEGGSLADCRNRVPLEALTLISWLLFQVCEGRLENLLQNR